MNALPSTSAPVRSVGASGARGSKALAVVPLALLSAAWTTHLAGFGSTATLAVSAPARSATTNVAVQPLVAVPLTPIEVPASLSAPTAVNAATDGTFVTIAATPSTSDIPAEALAAYQRAETVINAADTTCHLPWQLVAAVGRVESDHGRFAGSSIGPDGVVRPAILGPVLDGSNATSAIRDTDAGQYDGDLAFDRAVGPMQFIPSTWSVVGVDADNDGVRDPQDIDDAALAAAVYLCSGTEDLAAAAGQSAAVFRYNHSQAYVDTVLSIMNGYLNGDFAAVPVTTVSAGALVPLYPVAPVDAPVLGPEVPDEIADVLTRGVQQGQQLTSPAVAPIHHAAVTPVEPEVPAVPTDGGEPTGEEPTDPTPPVGEPTDPATPDPTTDPTTDPTGDPTTDPTAPVEPGESGEPSEVALASCAVALVDDPADDADEFDLCVVAFDEAVAAAEPGSEPAYPVPPVTTPAP